MADGVDSSLFFSSRVQEKQLNDCIISFGDGHGSKTVTN